MQRMRVRCTWLRLGVELRWAAGGVEAEDGRRVEALRVAREIGDEDMQVRRRNDLWRLADRLDQKLADFAGMAIGCATACDDGFARHAHRRASGRATRGVGLMIAAINVVIVRCAGDDVWAVVMAVVGREPVQALTEERDARVGSQQCAGQEFAKGVAHAGRCEGHGARTVKCIVGTGLGWGQLSCAGSCRRAGGARFASRLNGERWWGRI